MSHTRGPWTLKRLEGGKRGSGEQYVIAGPNPARPIVVGLPAGTAETVANYHLMTSAPELLDALKGILSVTDREHNLWYAARAAIAKAEGRDA